MDPFSFISGLPSYLPNSALGYLNLGAVVVAASSVAAASISKYTKNKTDDKIAAGLAKLHDLFGLFSFQPKLADKRAANAIRDHRSGK